MTTPSSNPANSLTAVCLVTLLYAASAVGATFSTNATMDAFVTTGPTGNLVNNNYGGAGSISSSAAGQEMGELQSVLQFNLVGAVSAFDSQFGAGQWTIDSVTLQLTAAPANNAIFNSPGAGVFGVSWMQNDSWQEGTGTPASPGTSGITFNSLQNTFISANDQSLGTFSFNGGTSGARTFSLGLAAGLVNDITAGENLSLRLFAADATVSGVFNSRNFGTVANRPLLTVVAVPEPSTIMLAGLGALLVTGWRWRRRRACARL
jgi:hypothetical protein